MSDPGRKDFLTSMSLFLVSFELQANSSNRDGGGDDSRLIQVYPAEGEGEYYRHR